VKIKYRIPFISTIAVLLAMAIINAFGTLYIYYTDKKEIQFITELLEKQNEIELKQNVNMVAEFVSDIYSTCVSEESVMQHYNIDLKQYDSERQSEIKKNLFYTSIERQVNALQQEGHSVWIVEAAEPYRLVFYPKKKELNGKLLEIPIEEANNANLWQIYSQLLLQRDTVYYEYNYKVLGKSDYFTNISYVKKMPEFGWIIGAEKGEEEIYAQIRIFEENRASRIRQMLFYTLIVSIITVLLLIRFTFFVGNKFSASLTELMRALMELTRGKEIEQLVIKDKHELGKMQRAINRISESMRNYNKFTKDLVDNNYYSELKLTGNYDELGKSLLNLRQKLQTETEFELHQNIENKKRNWHADGLENINNVLRKQDTNLEELAYLVLKDIIKYLHAGMGALYILKQDDELQTPYLDMLASYALEQRRMLKQRYELREGLPGTCAQEKSTLYLTEVPENYAKITSALGAANPKSLLFVPLKIENEIFGIIELGAFRELQDYEIAFTESVSKSIAATISNMRINERTNQLLEQTQTMAEELALNHEESLMKQAELEELKKQIERLSKL